MKQQAALDLLIVIALEEEANYLTASLSQPAAPYFVENRTLFRFEMPNHFSQSIAAGYVIIGDMGHEEAIAEMSWWLQRVSAKMIANIGISGMVSDDLKLGDVVLATDADHFLYRSKLSPAHAQTEGIGLQDLRLGGKVFPTSSTFRHADVNLQYLDPQKWSEWLQSSMERQVHFVGKHFDRLARAGLIRDKPKLVKGSIASSNIVGAHAAFKNYLKQQKNRNYLALDMESSAVLLAIDRHEANRPETLVLRGISDPADDRKSLLDVFADGGFRKQAIQNSLGVLTQIISATDFTAPRIGLSSVESSPQRSLGDICRDLHDTVLAHFIGRHYRKSLIESGTTTADFAMFFDQFTLAGGAKITDDFFDKLPSYIPQVENLVVLSVEGNPGTGKSAFLAICYWTLFQHRQSDPSLPVPFYINLHKYNALPSEDQASAATHLRDAFHADLDSLRALSTAYPETELVIIVDGDDGFCRFRALLQGLLRDILANLRHKKVLGVRSETEQFDDSSRKDVDVSLVVRLQQCTLSNIDLSKAIELFLKVASIDRTKQKADFIKQALLTSKLSEIDLFTLSMLSESFDRGVTSLPKSFSTIVEQFCEEFIARRLNHHGGMRQLIEKAAAVAFNQQIGSSAIIGKPSAFESAMLEDLVALHPRISEFLTAVHIVSQLESTLARKRQKKSFPEYVFTYRINRYCKELLNNNLDRQKHFVSSLNFILKAPFLSPGQKANAAYLAGRLDSNQARAGIKDALLICIKELETRHSKAGQKPDRQTLLFWRTVYISLAYMGDDTASDKYIDFVLNYPAWDNFNRGFHLEYYGDIPFTPSLPLQSDDDLGLCPNTFRQLSSRIASSHSNALWEIELTTLTSLAQHRHSTGKLREVDRISLQQLLICALSDQRLKHQGLANYVRMGAKLLSSTTFSPDSLFPQYFYHLKKVQRQGWLDRGLTNVESVCDHTFGAVAIAAFYLPAILNDESAYSKDRIISMLLWHDLAESVVGDVPSQKHSEETKQLERDVYEDIGMFGAIEGLQNLQFIRDFWREFESSSINGRIAKDIDRLENLVQLWQYGLEGRIIEDKVDWENSLRRRIQTPIGRQIMNRLENTFVKRS